MFPRVRSSLRIFIIDRCSKYGARRRHRALAAHRATAPSGAALGLRGSSATPSGLAHGSGLRSDPASFGSPHQRSALNHSFLRSISGGALSTNPLQQPVTRRCSNSREWLPVRVCPFAERTRAAMRCDAMRCDAIRFDAACNNALNLLPHDPNAPSTTRQRAGLGTNRQQRGLGTSYRLSSPTRHGFCLNANTTPRERLVNLAEPYPPRTARGQLAEPFSHGNGGSASSRLARRHWGGCAYPHLG